MNDSEEGRGGVSRIEAFSDGVIAIIITIMVLELKRPEDVSLAALVAIGPHIAIYALSFIYVGIYWNNHHHMLQVCGSVTGAILWANLHLLFWLSLVPFTAVNQLRGRMTGKIDLILEHDGRFHVLDYKSNYLGDRLDGYTPDALRVTMDDHQYRFQALLYTVAVDRMLRQRLFGYRREQHLGEAIYLFVRAVGLAPRAGIWRHRFDDALVEAADAALAGRIEGATA